MVVPHVILSTASSVQRGSDRKKYWLKQFNRFLDLLIIRTEKELSLLPIEQAQKAELDFGL